jgi:hypothetical protein
MFSTVTVNRCAVQAAGGSLCKLERRGDKLEHNPTKEWPERTEEGSIVQL